MELINPNATVSEPDLIDVSQPASAAPASPMIATNRVNKLMIGLPNSTIDSGTASFLMQDNREDELRKQAASELDMQRTIQQQKMLMDYAKTNGPMNPVQALYLQDIIKKKQVDPNSVIEENYADKFVSGLIEAAQANPNSFVADAIRNMPKPVESLVKQGIDLKSKKELINTALENAEDAAKAQSWPGYFLDVGKSLTAVYPEAKLRGMVKEGTTSRFEGGLGTNVQKQWQDMFDQPIDVLKEHLNGPVKQLIQDNPSLAVQWLSAGLGLSPEDKMLMNMGPLMDLGLGADAAKLASSVYRRAQLNQTANAVVQMVKDKEKTVTSAAIKEAAGDIRGAGTDDFASEMSRLAQQLKDLNVTPTGPASTVPTSPNVMTTTAATAAAQSPALKDLKAALNPHLDSLSDMGAPSGLTLRQEVVNRLRESMNTTFGSFISAMENSMKIEILPAVLASKRIADTLAKEMANQYRGLSNAIFNSRLLKDKFTGLWEVEHYILQNDGTLFGTERQARSFVEKMGLGEVEVVAAQGPGKPKVVKTPREYPEPKFENPRGDPWARDPMDVFTGESVDFDIKRRTVNKGYKDAYESDRNHVLDIGDRLDKESKYTSATIEQQGAGFYIVKRKPVPINAEYTRDLMITTAETQTPNKVLNAFGGWLGSARTPEETLALENLINRKIATFGASKFYDVFKENMKDITKLRGWPIYGTERRVKWNQWKDVMSWLENEPNQANGKKGVVESFSTPGELQEKYMQRLNRLPDDQEVSASFAYRNQEILKEQLLKFSKYKDQLRQGASNWTITVNNPNYELARRNPNTVAGKLEKTNFNGILQNKLPSGNDVVLILHSAGSGEAPSIENHVLRSGKQLTGRLGDLLEERIASGGTKVVKLTDADTYPLNKLYNIEHLGETRITHIISDTLEDKPLSWDHIKVNKPSNHDYDHYVVQPRVVRNPVSGAYEYLGDRTVAGFNIRAMSGQVADHLDQIRQALKADDEGLAKRLYDSSKLPMDYYQVRSWFKPDLSMEGTPTVPRLNLDERIHSVPNGKTTMDVRKDLGFQYRDNFENRVAQGSGVLQQNDPWDIFTLNNTGTKAAPEWGVAPTKFIDPMTSINRSLVRVINDNLMQDYKVFAVEHWVQEAKDLLKASPSELSSSPYYHFHNPRFLDGLTGPEAIKANNLMTAQMQIKQFLGVKDANTTFLHNAAQILSDSIYDRFGEKKYMLATADMLPSLRDPWRFMRSIAFNAKIGLFAPAQLLVQLQTFSSILGIAGTKAAAPGTAATLLHTWTRLNQSPEILEHMDKVASKIGFRPGEFKEARDFLSRSGFENVGGEHIYQDSTAYHDIVTSPTGNFLHAGQFLFREGERATRTGAFYTAYLEWRAANPAMKLTESVERQLLNRADTLAGNMSRASASAIQKGVWSIPTQFSSYVIRQAELMLGSRLNNLEKARLFGTYATLYGVPAAFGSFTMGIGGDYIMKNAIENGYVSTSSENAYLNTLITEGLPALVGQLTTGNLYNVGQRYAGGNGPVIDLLRGDKHLWEILGGASGSTIYKSVIGLDGLATAMHAGITGTGPFNIKPEDFMEPMKQVSSANAAIRLYQALNTGKWLSSKEMEMGDVTPMNALFMTATGLASQESSELSWITANKAQEKDQQAQALQKFTEEIRRGTREFDKGNPEQGNDYWNRAFRILRYMGYPEENWSKAIAIAADGDESMLQRIRLDYYLKNVPTTRQESADKAAPKYMKEQVK